VGARDCGGRARVGRRAPPAREVREEGPGAVIVVVVGILLVVAIDLDSLGVAIVGEIPQGLPEVGVPQLTSSVWFDVMAGGMALLLVGFSEGYASASAVAGHTGEDVDADQELVGSGAANIASGLVGGLAVSGSLSKSSAAQDAGARSQVSNLVAGLVVLATLLFLAPVFEKLPEPVLSAVVIVAVLPSANPRRVWALWPVNRLDFVAGLITFVLVLVWETLPAMIVAVVLSLAFVVRRASFPDVGAPVREDTFDTGL
jgi:SulP family sulfate permease